MTSRRKLKVGHETKWYVRPSGGSYGTKDGTSYANAFDGFSDIAWASFKAGDTLYVAGEHYATTLYVGASGTAGSPIVIASCELQYGASTEDPCTAFNGAAYTAATWSGPTNGVYSKTGMTGTYSSITTDGKSGSGTYAQTGTTLVVTDAAHGLVAGQQVELTITSGDAPSGKYVVVVLTSGTFSVQVPTGTTSGNCTWIGYAAPSFAFLYKKDSLTAMRIAQSLADCEATADSIYHNSGTSTLYYNPGATFETLMATGGAAAARLVAIMQKRYVTVRGLNLRGCYASPNGLIEVRPISAPYVATGLSAVGGPSYNIVVEDCSFGMSLAVGVSTPRATLVGWTANTAVETWSNPRCAAQYIAAESTAPVAFILTTRGTTGGTEPTWNTTDGATTADGTATWTCIHNFSHAVEGLTVRNCEFFDIVAGVYLFDLNNDVTIEDNHFYHTAQRDKRITDTIPGPYPWDWGGGVNSGGDAGAVSIWGNSNSLTVQDNHIDQWSGEGVFSFSGSILSGMPLPLPAASNKVTIVRNKVEMSSVRTSDWMMGIALGGYNYDGLAENYAGSLIANNLISGCLKSTDNNYPADYAFFCKAGLPPDPTQRVKLYNNTFVGNYRNIVIERAMDYETEVGIDIKNNVFSGVTDDGYFIETQDISGDGTAEGFTSDYNCFYGTGKFRFDLGTVRSAIADWQTDSGQDAHSITTDPLFVGNGDYSLQSGSPCVNTGTDTDLTDDLLGNPRPVGAYDIGAYERQ